MKRNAKNSYFTFVQVKNHVAPFWGKTNIFGFFWLLFFEVRTVFEKKIFVKVPVIFWKRKLCCCACEARAQPRFFGIKILKIYISD